MNASVNMNFIELGHIELNEIIGGWSWGGMTAAVLGGAGTGAWIGGAAGGLGGAVGGAIVGGIVGGILYNI